MYLFYEPETDEKARVVLIYNIEPPEELRNKSYFEVDTVPDPDPEQQVGKTALPYCNPKTKEFWYEYVDRPLTIEELTSNRVTELEEAILELSTMVGGE